MKLRCKECGYEFEQELEQDEPTPPCPNCEANLVIRLYEENEDDAFL